MTAIGETGLHGDNYREESAGRGFARFAETLHLSSVNLAELLFGIGALSSGRRKDALAQTLRGLLSLCRDRVLAFATDAARHYGELAVNARSVSKVLPTPDSYIAAIANARGFTVATRDVAPFQAAGLNVINPWDAQPQETRAR